MIKIRGHPDIHGGHVCGWGHLTQAGIFRPGAPAGKGQVWLLNTSFLETEGHLLALRWGSAPLHTLLLPLKLVSTAPWVPERPGVCGWKRQTLALKRAGCGGSDSSLRLLCSPTPMHPPSNHCGLEGDLVAAAVGSETTSEGFRVSQSLVHSLPAGETVCCACTCDFLPWIIIKPQVIKGFQWWPIDN